MSVKLVPLSQVLQFIRGITFKPENLVEPFVMGSAICMRTKNIQNELDQSDLIAVPQQFVKRDEQYLKSGDLLISSANSWELVGKTVRVPEIGHKCTAGGFISILRPMREAVDSDYLFRFIMHEQTQHDIRHLGRQTTNISNLDRKRFLELQIPLPSLPIQKQIAAVLEKADTLREQCQQMEQELNALAQSVFLEMFGDPVRNPKSWQKKSLSTVTDRIIDCPHTTPQWTADGITCLRTTNLTYGGWNFADHRFVDAEQYKERTSRSEIEPGDIILSREGTVGVAAIVDVGMKLCLGQRLVQVRPNVIKIHSEFLLYQLLFLLTPERLTQVMSGSTVKHLNMSDIRSLGVIVPPIEDQIQFKQVWTSIKSELIKTERQISSLDECFYSLMQRAFKGELDLTTNA